MFFHHPGAEAERGSVRTIVTEDPPVLLQTLPPCGRSVGDLPPDCPGWCEFFPGADSYTGGAHLGEGSVLADTYTLLQLLGRGGMGDVYAAKDRDGRIVAVKSVRSGLIGDPNVRNRFAVEARALRRVRHPNIVQLFDSGVADGVPYLVMEYIDGSNLETILKHTPKHRLAVWRARQFVAATCAAVQAMHDGGVVHCDLKAGNVFVAATGRAVVGDLGMARPLAKCCKTRPGKIEGTPSYLAPELATGIGSTPAPAADIYALGVLAFRVLTGRLPFEGERADVLRDHITAKPPRVSALRPGIPHSVDAAIERALRKDPSRRPETAAAFSAELLQ